MAATYKIGEAAALLNLKTYVLRFWETEFPEIAPLRTEKGQRLYTSGHLALLDRIRYLLHERGLTIGGARKVLAEERARGTVYVFGSHGRVRGLDAESSPPGRDMAPEPPLLAPEAEAVLLEDPETALPDDEAESADEDREIGLPGAPDGPVQCNLPGLEHLAAFRSSLLGKGRGLDSGGAEGYGGTEEAPAASGESPRGMLPLFAVARAAFLAGKASAGAREAALDGGGNFILAGGVAARTGKDGAAARAGKSGAAEDFRAIAGELEDIAALLRGVSA